MSTWIRRTDRLISAQLAAYRRELLGKVSSAAHAPALCPSCGTVSAAPRLASRVPEQCPSCRGLTGAGELNPVSGA
ncbi:MAG: hypothetical protein ACLP8S_22300 [Solirubrobacteraceae bacterium]